MLELPGADAIITAGLNDARGRSSIADLLVAVGEDHRALRICLGHAQELTGDGDGITQHWCGRAPVHHLKP